MTQEQPQQGFPTRLKAAPYNPRKIEPEAAEALAESMRQYGDISGFVSNVRTGNLVAGHQRLQQLPADYTLCRTSESTDAVRTVGYGHIEAHGTRWPVRFVDWPEEKEKAANIAANSPLMAGEFTDGLGLLLKEIELKMPEEEFRRLRFGELDVPGLGEVTGGETDPDAVPEPPDEATSKRGEIYQLGNHRLMCGDSGSTADLDALLGGQQIHLVHMDPPYNVRVEPRSNTAIAAGLSSFTNKSAQLHHQKFDIERGASDPAKARKKMRAKDRPLANDFVTAEAFDAMLLAWFGNASRVLKPGGSFYIWGGYAIACPMSRGRGRASWS